MAIAYDPQKVYQNMMAKTDRNSMEEATLQNALASLQSSGTSIPKTTEIPKSDFSFPNVTVGGITSLGQGRPTVGGIATINQPSVAPVANPIKMERDYIGELKAAQLASRIAALGKAKSNGLAALDTQQAAVEPAYYKQRNQVQGASDLGQMNFAQFMANRGIKGSQAAMPEIYRNNSLQANLGNLNQQQQGQYDTINNNRTGIENNYQADLASANAEVEAQAMQSYIDQMNTDKQLALQTAGLTGNLNGASTLAAQQLAAQNTQFETTNKQGQDQQAWSNKFQEGQAATQKSQYDATTAYNATRDQVLDNQWLDQYNANQQQLIVDNLYKKGQLSVDEKNAETSRISANASAASGASNAATNAAQLEWAKDPTNPANIKVNTSTTSTIDDYANTINSVYVNKADAYGTPASIDVTGIKAYLDGLIKAGVDPTIIDSLAARYGIQ